MGDTGPASASALASLLSKQASAPSSSASGSQPEDPLGVRAATATTTHSPSLKSQSPSPLVLSECSSPSLSSPPPAPGPPPASSSLFYRSDHLHPPPPPPLVQNNGSESAVGAASAASFVSSLQTSSSSSASVSSGAVGLESVLTHEHNDPMLSASAPAAPAAPASATPSSSAAVSVMVAPAITAGQMRPVVLQERPQNTIAGLSGAASSSNGLPTSIQLPTVPLPPQQQIQQTIQPPQASPVPVPVPVTLPVQSSPAGHLQQLQQQQQQPHPVEVGVEPPDAGSKPEPPRKDRLTLYGCFAANLTDPKSAAPKAYIIHVFDKGSYFKSGSEPDALLLEQLSRGTGVLFEALYAKNNPNRVTFDQVLLKLNHQWISVPKPGTAVQAMEYVSADTVFFLQATALLKVNLFVQKQSGGVPWITDCRFVTNTNIQNAIVHTDFNVLITASSKTTANRRPAATAPVPAPAPAPAPARQQGANGDQGSETLHLSSGTITLHSSSSGATNGTAPAAVDPAPTPPAPAAFAGPSTAVVAAASPAAPPPSSPAVLTRNCDYQLTDSQYPQISLEQVTHCTSCAQCNRRFKYAIENFFHFVMSPPCRNFVLKSRRASTHEEDGNGGNAAFSFSHTLYTLIATQCALARDVAFRCDACAATVHGPLQYCIHRDQHQPVHGDLALCQFCGIIFRTPHAFYRHKCISAWDLKTTLSKFEKAHLPLPMGTDDAFKIYSHLTEDEKAKILKCPVCGKALCYMSGLMAHLKSSSECFSSLRQQAQRASLTNECVDLAGFTLAKLQMAPRPLRCETCGLDSRNQVAYAIHRDHHTLKKQGMLICKGCNSEYRAPCEFYRHNCSSQKNAIKLQWCPFCEVARHCDRLKENNKVAGAGAAQAQGAAAGGLSLGSAASPASVASAPSPSVTSPAPSFPPDASPSPATPQTPLAGGQELGTPSSAPFNPMPRPTTVMSTPTAAAASTVGASSSSASSSSSSGSSTTSASSSSTSSNSTGAALRTLNCDNLANTSSSTTSASSTASTSELMKRLLSSEPAPPPTTSGGASQPPPPSASVNVLAANSTSRPKVVKAEIDDERDELEEALRKIHQGEEPESEAGKRRSKDAAVAPAGSQLDGHSSYSGGGLSSEDDEVSEEPPRRGRKRTSHPTPAKAATANLFLCTECSPYKILRGSEGVAAHTAQTRHAKINRLGKMYANKADLDAEEEEQARRQQQLAQGGAAKAGAKRKRESQKT